MTARCLQRSPRVIPYLQVSAVDRPGAVAVGLILVPQAVTPSWVGVHGGVDHTVAAKG